MAISDLKIITSGSLERGLAYGEGCFETFRVTAGAIFAWSAHMQRLTDGLAEFAIVLSDADLEMLREAVCREAAACADDALVRLTVGGGEAPWGLMRRDDTISVAIQVLPCGPERAAARLRLKHWPFPLKPKPAKFTADYAETLRALKGEQDADVLFERDDHLIAAATANLLIYRHGVWWTPGGDGVLPGIIRQALIDSGGVRESACPVSWLDDCEAMAVVNSGHYVRPVTAVAHRCELDPHHPALRSLRYSIEALLDDTLKGGL